MSGAMLVANGVPAVRCQLATYHRPTPLRFVWHHILPQVCGGKTEPGNLAPVCDSCHYSVHALLWMLKNDVPIGGAGSRTQRALARRGYLLAELAGTIDKIPHE